MKKPYALILSILMALGAVLVGAPTASAATHMSPGSNLIIMKRNAVPQTCALTTSVTQNGTTYGVTAGHCLLAKNITEIRNIQGRVIASKSDIDAGRTIFRGNRTNPLPKPISDYASFRLKPGVYVNNNAIGNDIINPLMFPLDAANKGIEQAMWGNARVGEPYRIANWMRGKIACKQGNTTGTSCGPILDVDVKNQNVWGLIPSLPGDSGSPLYIMGGDGKKHIIGQLSGGSTYLFKSYDGLKKHTS